jgi:TonB family protein
MHNYDYREQRRNPVKENSLGVSLLFSLILHGLAIMIAPLVIHDSRVHREDFFSVKLVEFSSDRSIQPLAEMSKPATTKLAKLQVRESAEKSAETEFDQPAAQAPIEPTPKPIETKPAPPAKNEATAVAPGLRGEGGGSDASAGHTASLEGNGLAPGTAITGGAGGNATAGLGRDFGASGFPAQAGVLRTNRSAKPIQTARAAYPPMALRAGIEADVQLKIEVGPQGNVIKAEIIKSGGAGFDEEALRAVKQSRFEPAQRDGQNVPAEFTFVYRFRLQR